jgi:hypothetical protein
LPVVVFVVLLSVAFLFSRPRKPRKPPQEVTVRHVASVQSGDVTTMTFEITNHTADPYIFHPFEVQLRNGKAWTKFQGFDITKIHPKLRLAPRSVASYSVNVTNLPADSVVRFSISPQKVLMGVEGFARRAELELKRQTRGTGGGGIPLNPNDKNSQVFGLPTEVVTDEWVEAGH